MRNHAQRIRRAVAVVAFLTALAGCDGHGKGGDAAGKAPVEVAPGSGVYWSRTTETDAGHAEQSAKGAGAGLSTNAPEVAGTFKAEAPTASLRDGASGGGTDFDFKLGQGGKPLPFIIGGILALLAAGAAGYLRYWRAAVFAVGVSAVLFTWAVSPLAGFCVLAAVVIAGAALLFMGDGAALKFKEGLRAVAAGVADSPPDVQSVVKKNIGAHADDRDKKTIKAIKRADDLG